MTALWIAALLGLAQGIRHAFEPDHLAAVSTLAGERAGTRGGLVLGAAWGVGHTLSLLVVGGTLAALDAHLPDWWSAAFELVVAVMLVVLGVRAVRLALREGSARQHLHRAGARVLVHSHLPHRSHVHAGQRTIALRPLLVGLVHGLAGSGAIAALVLAELPDVPARLGYIALFGLGSIVGMAALTALAGRPLALLRRAPVWAARVFAGVGGLSLLLGLYWGAASLQELLSI